MLSALSLVALIVVLPACPVAATTALPQLTGRWEVIALGRLDGPRPDTMRADAHIEAELQGCVLRERLVAPGPAPTYEALVYWGVNGVDGAVQRTLVHSQHGRFGVYQGRRAGSEIALRQMPVAGQPGTTLVEHVVSFRDRDHFTITSRLSEDGGMTWRTLARWEYRRTAP